MNSNETFNYSYSSAQQQEIKKIREKYSEPEKHEDKMDRLRRLDKSVTKPGMIAALIIGIVSTLVMGAGMSMCMVQGSEMFFPGIIVGVAGMIGVIIAYPIYSAITKKRRKKLAPEILRLSEELMQ